MGSKIISGFIGFMIGILTLVVIVGIAGVGNNISSNEVNQNVIVAENKQIEIDKINNEEVNNNIINEKAKDEEKRNLVDTTNKITLLDIPEFESTPYVEINGNIPFFDDSELTTNSYEYYSELDKLGRVGIATACIGVGMDDKPRENISYIKPTGWKDTKYNGIDGSNLYNRCHLIAQSLTGENANEKNLMTGTRFMNTEGMLRFENRVSDYVNNTKNHVLYRVTPMFNDDDMLAKGVLIEAKSVEDNGKGIQFNVFCYNVQPGIEIDYKTGESKRVEETSTNELTQSTAIASSIAMDNSKNSSETSSSKSISEQTTTTPTTSATKEQTTSTNNEATYVLNKNTKKFHYSWCSSVNSMKEKNKEYSNSSRDSLISRGYQPCKKCSP
ncbi:MAG: DNA/RNA non-specific endonuclease [Clostridia bacterium]|nr:DNA/RNA non-specific endonuclease [Clostridia bacterium]